MARGGRDDGRDPVPATRVRTEPETGRVALPPQRSALPQGPDRELTRVSNRAHYLRGSEARVLTTVGAFRVVPVADLEQDRGQGTSIAAEMRRLVDERLVERASVIIHGRATPVVTLTRQAKQLLDAYRDPLDDRPQEYHAGFVKPREIAHDAQLYGMYRAEAAQIQADGGRVTRVVLDYELKRDYQTFLNRRERPDDESVEDGREAFAHDRGLPIIDGHLELPDLRIEYESADGVLSHRDLELVTEHYSRAQLSGKARAGFVAYRLSTSGSGARGGGTPFDPHYLEWLT
jgi:hypothetical protein